jgi:hypothetical protein
METTEKIAFLYLRFNGFFLMPHFTVFGLEMEKHVDVLGFRPSGSEETIGDISLCRDKEFIEELGGPENDIALWAEVGTGHAKDLFHPEKEAYVRRLFGERDHLKKIYFNFDKKEVETIVKEGDRTEVSAGRCRRFILERFSQMETEQIGNLLNRMTKTGSWRWSEEFLADLLCLRKMGFLASKNQHIAPAEDVHLNTL